MTSTLLDAAKRAYDKACEIKATAEREQRNYTDAEAKALDALFAEAEALAQAEDARQEMPRPAIGPSFERHPPGSGPMAAYTGGVGRMRDDRRGGYAEVLEDSEGRKVYALGPKDRLSDANPPRSEPFNLARFVAAVHTGDWSKAGREYQVWASQQTTVGSEGGFLVPEFLSREVIDLARDRMRIVQAGARTIAVPGTTLDVARVVSGPTPHWRAELQVIPRSDAVFDRITLRPRTAAALMTASIELLQDAPNADQQLRGLLAEALAEELDRVALMGSGVGEEPTGLLTMATGSPSTGVNHVVLSDAPNYSDFLDAALLIEEANGTAGTIVMNPRTRRALRNLVTGLSGDLTPLQPPPGWADFRVLTTNKIPVVTGSPANLTTAFVGDFREMAIGLRGQLQLAVATAGGEREFEQDDLNSPAEVGDAFSRYGVRIRAVLRADIAFFRPAHFTVMSDLVVG